jgi:hypothetical protein
MRWVKTMLIVAGAVGVTALGIDAADTFSGARGTLLSQVISGGGGSCPKGMASVSNHETLSCVDVFEASTGTDCPTSNPANMLDSLENLNVASCVPESKERTSPWTFVTRDQALQACARAGKRLPTSAELYALSLGMGNTDAVCNTSSGEVSIGGAYETCVSPHGAYDLVGNVWEWVLGDVAGGRFEDRTLPPSGYVGEVDSNGMATLTTTAESDLFDHTALSAEVSMEVEATAECMPYMQTPLRQLPVLPSVFVVSSDC